jgi:hypothetical protein
MRSVFIVALVATLSWVSCKTVPDGMTEVKTPFSGNKYQSNKRLFRAVGSGQSVNLETSRDRAMLSARQRLAAEVQTQVKNVSESYRGERTIDDNMGDFNERFQQLTREVMNQVLVESQVFDSRTFISKDKRTYTTYIAMEARKKVVYRKLKEIAQSRTSLSQTDRDYISRMIDEAIKETEDDD